MGTENREALAPEEEGCATILLVDDDPNQRDMYKRRLERRGYVVRLASGADAAAEALRARRPDLVVLDIAMPERDGLSALQEFLDIDPSLPVIINTAYPAYADSFIAWAADGYVEKSADLQPLLSEFEKALTKRRAYLQPEA